MKVVHHLHDEIESTNKWSKSNFHFFDKDSLTIVTAKNQKNGVGRKGRSWTSPAGKGLYTTFCFFIPREYPFVTQLAQFFTLQAALIMEKLGFLPKIKWPNDLMFGNKKVAGILCEIVSADTNICVLAGIGININFEETDLNKIDQPATSLLVESGHRFDIDEILMMFEDNLAISIPVFIEKGFEPFFEMYKERLIVPKAAFLRKDGALLVNGNGIERIYYSVD